MRFAIDHVIWFLDATALNPLLAAIPPLALHHLTNARILFRSAPGALLPYTLRPLPGLQKLALGIFGLAVCRRLSHWAARRALNNGTKLSPFRPEDEIVVVTGGAGGFGGEAVRKFASAGAKVVVLDVLPLTYPKPSGVYYYRVDLTDYHALEQVAKQVSEEIGEPTVVIANAGICRGKPVLHATPKDIEVTMGVNTLAVFWCAKVFLPAMIKKNHGHFLITSSTTAFLSTAGITDYAASKAATLAISEGLQSELKHIYKAPSVRVSALCPSLVRTKMFDTAKSSSSFFWPELTVEDIANHMYDIVTSGSSQRRILPLLATMMVQSRALPEWFRVSIQDAAAGAMVDLKPHNPLAEGKQ
ncbi:NAD(P)-binding protein, partial [Aureobasidium melanogenum]